MQVEVKAEVSQGDAMRVSRGLEEMQEALSGRENLAMTSKVVSLPKDHDVEDDNGGGVEAAFQISTIAMTVGVGVLTALAKDSIVASVRYLVSHVVRTISGNKRLSVLVKVHGKKFDIMKAGGRKDLKDFLDEDLTPKQRQEIEDRFKEINAILEDRYPGA